MQKAQRNNSIVCLPDLPEEYSWEDDGGRGFDCFVSLENDTDRVEDKELIAWMYSPKAAGDKGWHVRMSRKGTSANVLLPVDPPIKTEQDALDIVATRVWLGMFLD